MMLLVFITHIFGAKLNIFSVQRFENAFQRDLSRVKRYDSSGETAFFAAHMSGKYYTVLS